MPWLTAQSATLRLLAANQNKMVVYSKQLRTFRSSRLMTNESHADMTLEVGVPGLSSHTQGAGTKIHLGKLLFGGPDS